MLDFSHIPFSGNTDIQTFFSTNASGTTFLTGSYGKWQKPRGAKFVYMILSGGGGSGGVGAAAGAAGGAGGAGGGAGGVSTLFIPAMFLPDALYVYPGYGGQQPNVLVPGAASVAGGTSVIVFEPYNTGVTVSVSQITVLAAVPSVTALSLLQQNRAGLGIVSFLPGVAGPAGVSSGVGLNLIYTGIGITTTGASGGSQVNSSLGLAGGGASGATTAGGIVTIPGGEGANGSTPAENGFSGSWSQPTGSYPFQFYGGGGGGGCSNVTGGIAGDGGNGGPGCGGGGSGTGLTTVGANPNPGRPGDGGPGFAFIYSW